MCENKNNRIPLHPITNNISNSSPISSPSFSSFYSPPPPLSSSSNNVPVSDFSMESSNIDENLGDFPPNLSISSSSSFCPSLPYPLNRISSTVKSPSSHRNNKHLSGNKRDSNSFNSLNNKQKIEREEKKRVNNDFLLLKNPSGHQYSMDQNQLLLTQIHGAMVIRGMEECNAINFIADVSGCHIDTLKSIYSKWKSTHVIPSPNTTMLGRGNPSHPLHLPPFSIEIECEIHRLIAEFNH